MQERLDEVHGIRLLGLSLRGAAGISRIRIPILAPVPVSAFREAPRHAIACYGVHDPPGLGKTIETSRNVRIVGMLPSRKGPQPIHRRSDKLLGCINVTGLRQAHGADIDKEDTVREPRQHKLGRGGELGSALV